MSNNLANWFFGGTKNRELQDTLALHREVAAMLPSSPLFDDEALRKFTFALIVDSSKDFRAKPNIELGGAMWEAVHTLLYHDGIRLVLPDEKAVEALSIDEAVEYRQLLRRAKKFMSDSDRILPLWRKKLERAFSEVLAHFPLSAFDEFDDESSEQSNAIPLPEATVLDQCDRIAEAIEGLIFAFSDDDIIGVDMFRALRQRLWENLVTASGIPLTYDGDARRKFVYPTDKKGLSPEEMVRAYLGGTPFEEMFAAKVPFAIPFPARFEHTHIVAGSGHGKTQLLQFLVHHDLLKSLEDNRSVIVMDSQGDMIRTLSHLKLFDSSEAHNLADRFVLVDPTDVEHPVGLNMFDFDRARVGTLSVKDREMILNATVETYEYFFGALLGAELTQRQGVVFRYIARLMMEIPGATIHTLLELMMNGEKYRPYMERLSGTARVFFETQFFDRHFAENKKQIVARLWGVLSNTTLERMFSHPQNKLDLFRLTQEGKIILVNTAKDFLGHEGSSIFGRFIVSLIAQAAIQRAILPSYERTPTFAYIDEAEDYFDSNIDRLVNQARKFKIGLVFSHQNLDQLSPALRASVLASTSIKFAGGLSSKDANALDAEFRTDADFLLAQKKRHTHTEFACYVKNFTQRALSVRIPLGYVEEQLKLDAEAYEALIAGNRERYGIVPTIPDIDAAPPSQRRERPARMPEQPPAPKPVPEPVEALEVPVVLEPVLEADEPLEPASEPILRATASVPRYTPKEPGGGGKQHRYLAHLVKQLAEERGFKSVLEQEILDGAGRVDVVLSRGERRIAVEISVTTGRDWELQNVEKCLSAGFTEVLVVSTNERHLKSLSRFIPSQLEEKVREHVRFLSAEDFIDYLDKGSIPPETEKTVRGYKVRVTSTKLSEEEAETRRSAIAEVIAKSMQRAAD